MEREGFGETHVVSEDIHGAVIAVRLLLEAVPEVVLGDEMACGWVERTGEETGREEVEQRAGAEELQKRAVEEKLCDGVGEVCACEGLSPDEGGADGVEKYLECAIGVK